MTGQNSEEKPPSEQALEEAEDSLSTAQKEREESRMGLQRTKRHLQRITRTLRKRQVHLGLRRVQTKTRHFLRRQSNNKREIGELASIIVSKQSRKAKANKQVRTARAELVDKKRTVTKTAVIVNAKAFVHLLKRIKTEVEKLHFYSRIVGLFLSSYQIPSTLLSPFIASLLMLYSLFTLVLGFPLSIAHYLYKVSYKFIVPISRPGYTEYLAGVLPGLVKNLPVKKMGVYSLISFVLVVLPLAVWPPYSSSDSGRGSDHLELEEVKQSISKLQKQNDSLRSLIEEHRKQPHSSEIGNIKQAVSDLQKAAKSLRSLIQQHGHDDPVTESRLRQYVGAEMKCGESMRVEMSKFIHFKKGSDTLVDFPNNRPVITDFIAKNPTSNDWFVFGFASADGEKRINKDLSAKRAKTVKDEIERRCSSSPGSERRPNCSNKKIAHEGMGERHPINGVANSRSAVIAACSK